MPEVKNLNNVWLFMDAVMNQNRGVDKLPNACMFCYWTTEVWEPLEEIYVIQDSIAKALSRGRKIGPGVSEDFLKLR